VIRPKVLFICSSNSCRTQIAEGFLRDLAGDRFEALSAGYEPSQEVCRDAVDVMREIGIDISGHRPKKTDAFLGQRVGFVITLCDREKEPGCPIFPGAIWRITWPVENPLITTPGAERKAAIREVREEIRRRVVEFVHEHAGNDIERNKEAWN
jgi:arsenate reductase (thioredoxin)